MSWHPLIIHALLAPVKETLFLLFILFLYFLLLFLCSNQQILLDVAWQCLFAAVHIGASGAEMKAV